ncbi:MAG: phospholipase [Rhodanobacter sp.]|jgi:hypothetical protein
MPSAIDHQQQQALIEQLRASGDTAALGEAASLQTLYHDREMAGLSEDVYASAQHAGRAPVGWTRISEHSPLLDEYASKLHMTAKELMDRLQPDISGFRAEIYIPNPEILGPGYKPTLAMKGSSGQVMTSQGLRDTTKEDFLANNFPQSIGLETDYYNRAMSLALELKRRGSAFEMTGHSLSGGMVAAASAVTGNTATTFNAAGLNPETVRRFGAQNGVPVLHPHQLETNVTSYQVQGELLTDGVQGNVHRMDVLQRFELGGVLKEAGQLLTSLPQGQELLTRQLADGIPMEQQATVRAFVERLANGHTDQMLRELPLSAGRVQTLTPMTRKNPDDPTSALVAREATLSLSQVTVLAAPVLEAARVAALGAQLGERGGQVVAGGGRLAHQTLHAYGEGWRVTTAIAGRGSRAATQAEAAVGQAVMHVVGNVAAGSVEISSEVQARLAHGVGRSQELGASLDAGLLRGAGRVLPAAAEAWLNAQAEQFERAGAAADHWGEVVAASARQQGHGDAAAIRAVSSAMQHATENTARQAGAFQYQALTITGQIVGGAFGATGHYVYDATRGAPALGAAGGAVVGTMMGAGLELNAANYPRLVGAVVGAGHVSAASAEALDRHLMHATVIPSMDSRVEQAEQRARQTLQHLLPNPGSRGKNEHELSLAPDLSQAPSSAAPARASYRDSGHPQHALYEKLKEVMPPQTSAARLTQSTAACHMAGLDHPGQLEQIHVSGKAVVILGNAPGGHVSVDLTSRPPSVEQTMQQVQAFDLQQASPHAQIHQQQHAPMLGGSPAAGR